LGFINWHWHDELQLCIVTRGVVNFCVNEDSVLLSEGQGIFINKAQLHRASDYQKKDSAYICLNFHPHLLLGFEGSIQDSKYVSPYIENMAIQYFVLKPEIAWQNRVMDIIRGIYTEYEEGKDNYELDIIIDLLRIWREFILYCFPSFPKNMPGNDKKRCKQIITYIEQHYAEKINLAELAAELHLSQGTCCRNFKEAMKCTIFEYIMDYRIIKSAKMLLTTNDSINEITYKCGFSNASYFIEQFKKKTHMTPNAYRQNNPK
jgi:AraC-like DNA-binding protein